MDYTKLINKLETDYLSKLSPKRADHSRRTAQVAFDLAKKYGLDTHKAYFAGLSHDIAKEKKDNEILNLAEKYQGHNILDEERKLPHLLHGRAAAALLNGELGIVDRDILESVTWHISGHEEMTDLDKIIYCSDYLEPGRKFLTELFRKEALSSSLDNCVKLVLLDILKHRLSCGLKPSTREKAVLLIVGGKEGDIGA